MVGIFRDLLSWPDGIIVGNLIASAVWATPTFIHLHHKMNKHHHAHIEHINKLHRKIEENSAQGN